MNSLLKVIDAMGEILRAVLSDEAFSAFKKQQDEIRKIVLEHEHIKVPIVGIYSSGKTSLINCLLGEEGKLPVGRDPITAIPCEILPVEEEGTPHIEVFREDEVIFDGTIEEFADVVIKPGDFARYYCSSILIRCWYDKGIVLVDMPGADSGVKQHNDALLQYIKNGTVYVFLQDCLDGSLSKSGLKFVDEIMSYGLESYVFVSRIDLEKSAENLNSTIEYIKSQIEGKDKVFYGGAVSSKDGKMESFHSFLDNLDAHAKGREQMGVLVATFIESQIQILRNMTNVLSDPNAGDLEKQIQDLEDRIFQIKRGLEEALDSADTPEKSTDDILNRLEKKIYQNATVVAQAFLDAKKGNRINAVSQILTEILRPELVEAFSDEQKQYITALQTDIDALTSKLLENTKLDDGTIVKIIEDQSQGIILGIKLIAEKLIGSGNQIAVIIGQVLAFVAEYVPDFLRSVFGRSDQEIIEDLKKKVRTVICAEILKELRPSILNQVKQMQKYVLDATRKRYEAQISQLTAQLNSLRKAAEKGQEALDGERGALVTAMAELEKVRESLLKKD